MATFGRLTNAILSATNENVLALANVNFDFSVFKFDAPMEFHALGASLSKQRRYEAEDGSAHKTARRLGALFKDLVPTTPCLIRAYGTRTSEIAASPDTNPKGSSRDGPFKDYVGIDGTSLWAAATSSENDGQPHSALAIHLLACMLARSFTTAQAISIWVELVRARRQEIERKAETEPQLIATWMAARQDITRDQLALWDASARSWLRGADETKKVQRTQLQLVIDNLHLRFGTEGSTYDNVMHVWRNAMVCVERCIKGTPQQVSDGSILLALSSWHLYPDLIVAHQSTTRVPFKDSLLETSGALTIGLELSPGSRPAGVHWSLVLSHLNYYGNAVNVQSSSEIQRFTIDQILVMTFGNLLQSWNIPKHPEEQSFCAKWLIELSDALDSSAEAGEAQEIITGDEYSWIRILALAGRKYLVLHHSDPRTCTMITGWGRRRTHTFLGSGQFPPFFHLNNPLITAALRQSDPLEAGVCFLRCLAKEMKLKPGEAVIRASVESGLSSRIELITAIPHTTSPSKQGVYGTSLPREVHCRWVGVKMDSSQDVRHDSCSCEVCDGLCPCAQNFGRCDSNTYHPVGMLRSCNKVDAWAAMRDRTIVETLKEQCYLLPPQRIHDSTPSKLGSTAGNDLHTGTPLAEFDMVRKFTWKGPPDMFHKQEFQSRNPHHVHLLRMEQ